MITSFPSLLTSNNKIKLKSCQGDYLHRPDTAQGVTTRYNGIGNEWIVELIGNNKVKLKSWQGDYLHRRDTSKGVTTWTSGIGNEWIVESIGNNKVKLKSWKGDYLHRLDTEPGLTTRPAGIGTEWIVELDSTAQQNEPTENVNHGIKEPKLPTQSVQSGNSLPKTVFISVDIQNDYFSGGLWELPDMEMATVNAVKLLDLARSNNIPVVHIQHIFSPDSNATFFIDGTYGVEIHQSVKPLPGEYVIKKLYANSFRETNLMEVLNRLEAKRLVIFGAMVNNCIEAITRAAVDFGFDCVVVHDACAARPLEFRGHKVSAKNVHCAFMAALEFAYCPVVSNDEFFQLQANYF
ncbi:isochorismatase family protein [Chrysosporum bergii ANA360D]|uniref:Isochorismatase family protein n=1 Tax=Chrysosporum bergii ANA360D TaxID=617107 RepID=A0AA43GR33_9CYAN|nr:isochorismatase family protein [Chrysosporum bergii]MDH6060188.1 isochorismatase family protein [Chrysosporum bergii ANA360D]